MLLAASYSNNNGFDEGDKGSRAVVGSSRGAGKCRGGHAVDSGGGGCCVATLIEQTRPGVRLYFSE